MRLRLRVWRQAEAGAEGRFERYEVAEIDPDASFLEMLDVLNDRLVSEGERAIAFDHDCREGICGSCSLVIDGDPARAAAGDQLPDLHARLRGRRRGSPSSRSAAPRSRSSAT